MGLSVEVMVCREKKSRKWSLQCVVCWCESGPGYTVEKSWACIMIALLSDDASSYTEGLSQGRIPGIGVWCCFFMCAVFWCLWKQVRKRVNKSDFSWMWIAVRLPAYQCHTLGTSVSCSWSWFCVCLCVWQNFFSGFAFVLSVESAGWRGIWLERMLPAERGLVSRQRPLIDTLPNAVGLKYKSSPPLPRTYARRAQRPICTPRFPPLAFLPPFRFHTSPSSPASVAHNLWLRPALFQLSVTKLWRASRHFISIYPSTSYSSLSACL